jgi:PilZ domain-containing protein
MGSCHLEGEPADLWRDCGVFDFSSFGLGMDLRHPSDRLPGRVSVRLPAGASIDVTLTGEVRSEKAGPNGVTRVGIEFVDLSKTERSIVDQLKLGVGSKIGHRNNVFPAPPAET